MGLTFREFSEPTGQGGGELPFAGRQRSLRKPENRFWAKHMYLLELGNEKISATSFPRSAKFSSGNTSLQEGDPCSV